MENKVKLKIKKGDKVRVIAGNNKGQEGQVVKVLVEKNRAIIEGVNLVTRHIKPSAKNPEGGVNKMEAPIHISNIVLLDPKSGKPTKVGRKEDKNGKLKRYSRKTNEFID